MGPVKLGNALSSYNELDLIVTNLYQLPNKVQFCHHLTTSFAAHKALDGAYETLGDLKDSIVEKLIGYHGNRFNTLSLSPLTGYTEAMNSTVANEIIVFGEKLEEWSKVKDYSDIENLAQEYSGAGAQLKYLLTLT